MGLRRRGQNVEVVVKLVKVELPASHAEKSRRTPDEGSTQGLHVDVRDEAGGDTEGCREDLQVWKEGGAITRGQSSRGSTEERSSVSDCTVGWQERNCNSVESATHMSSPMDIVVRTG
ncbi:hypothetical protein Hypma_002087 [Hypsizygus marmoreus]|uniref:Uncharacterized protein n=1 Tax=Hypsizygus marmoreus TaxID=39966 RepID=A0A369KAB9_HYPMA|nr:hypothetical protein Hypma_002087 [Hypsizygus marmoreus]